MKFENFYNSSEYDLKKFIADSKNSQLYIRHTLVLRAIEFIDKPKETEIFLEEFYRENGFEEYCYKYDGEIKSSHEITKNFFYFDPEITKSEKGKKIISDMFLLKKKYPNDSYTDLLRTSELEPQSEAIESEYEHTNSYNSYKGYQMYTGNSMFVSRELSEVWLSDNIYQRGYDDDYMYLTRPGPFTLIYPKEQSEQEVYLEYETQHELTWLHFKDEGFDNLDPDLSLLYENIKKHGKK